MAELCGDERDRQKFREDGCTGVVDITHSQSVLAERRLPEQVQEVLLAWYNTYAHEYFWSRIYAVIGKGKFRILKYFKKFLPFFLTLTLLPNSCRLDTCQGTIHRTIYVRHFDHTLSTQKQTDELMEYMLVPLRSQQLSQRSFAGKEHNPLSLTMAWFACP